MPSKVSTPPCAPDPSPKPERRGRKKAVVNQEDRDWILRLGQQQGRSSRQVSDITGVTRPIVRRILEETRDTAQAQTLREAPPLDLPTATPEGPPPSKLAAFAQAIQERVKKGLTAKRILREIREQGYKGSHSILRQYILGIRPAADAKKKVFRRIQFEPGEEMQIDWSPYLVPLGGVMTRVHAFGATLAWSRKMHVSFHLDERQPTLLEAHVQAFEYFEGVAAQIVHDGMATITLGRFGPDRTPLWHPRYLEFTAYYGTEPYQCRVRHPDRKGIREKDFRYLEDDFVRGSSWESLPDMNCAVRRWLYEIANKRVHGTTQRVPDEAWLEEKPFLIALPDQRYMTAAEEDRKVGPDAILSVQGTSYSVPSNLARQTVKVRLYSTRFEVLDRNGKVAFERDYVPRRERGRFVIDPAHYGDVPWVKRSSGSARRIEDVLEQRFPTLLPLLTRIRERSTSIAHVPLRMLLRLAGEYGDEPFLAAATRAQLRPQGDSHLVRRLLERAVPLPPETAVTSLGASAAALAAVSDVESGSLEDYADLDTMAGGAAAGDAPTMPADELKSERSPDGA